MLELTVQYRGSDGVDLALKILQQELQEVMTLVGVNSVKEIGRHHLSRDEGNGRFVRMTGYFGPKL